ncbi:FAD-dependent oxidoreductase [Candidimonas nitroreducens]|uniref:FAD-dependent oxidoreductase n=1 Tax=Candidimonas nitroreducens TaxID=683354 RepID=A0A225MRK6_9BURK|nr:FAD-dependent oxidoreductase [Candidimonas nitroreducens]OWT63702.1 FAD-dependent oxidoreductase [Candidimonas nitroreducens]
MATEFKPYPFDFVERQPTNPVPPAQQRHPVAIVGGGVCGITAALALARQGVPSVVLEADTSVCYGSRAICISRRSLEIFERLGAEQPMLEKGLGWTGGRSYYGDTEVLHFSMPHDASQKLPPMINIQQYYLEEFLVQAAERHADLIDIRWGAKVTGLRNEAGGVQLDVAEPGHSYTLQADWAIASDGGRSFMREALGLQLQGTAYEGRYIVADILLDCELPTERLAWFDPPSNPGSTILMHKQPDNVWRIDYQLRDDEDPDEAVKPENVLPRVRAHLEMIGLKGSWEPLWITIYKANALSLERYRHGRVLFMGDAAHLVPIFGVRGANSAIDDADNLSWKLACVVKGLARDTLLDSYSEERVYAAHENLASGMKSTEFMAPPSFAFKLMREAVLNLALDTPGVRSLINPRQTSAIAYRKSSLNAGASEDSAFIGGPAAGVPLPNVPVSLADASGSYGAGHLLDLLRAGEFLILHFSAGSTPAGGIATAAQNLQQRGIPVRLASVAREAAQHSGAEAAPQALDASGKAFDLYDATPGTVYVVRPDGHVLGRWRSPAAAVVEQAIGACLNGTA